MLGRKREVLVPKTGGPSKRRWQEDADDSEQEEVTAEELEQWRKREEQQKDEDRDSAKTKAARAAGEKAARARERDASSSPEPAGKRRKKFAWMDSDEEDDGDGDDGEEEEENGMRRKAQAPVAAPPAGAPERAAAPAASLPKPVFPPLPPVPAGHSIARLAQGVAAAAELQALLIAAASQFPPAPPDAGVAAALAGAQLQHRPVMPSLPVVVLPPAAGAAAPLVAQHVQPPLPPQVWNRAATPRVNQGLEDERLIVRIKRYVDLPGGGGYGFIDCEDTKLRFSRDVYIHKNQMHGLSIGDSVSFTIVRNNKGEPQARNVMRSEDALLLRAGGSQQAGDSWQSPAANPVLAVQPISAGEASSLMSESQARQFQESLRASGR